MDFMAAHSIYEEREILRQPCVLYKEYNGFWSPISALYWSTSSRILVSRHPFSCIEEIISQYCPQCLSRYMEAELRTSNRCPACFQCPCCLGVLSRGANADGTTFTCTCCGWVHTKVNVIASPTSDGIFNDILKSLKEEEASNWTSQVPRVNSNSSTRWKMTDLESSLQSKSSIPRNLKAAQCDTEIQSYNNVKSDQEFTSLIQRLAHPGSQPVMVVDLEPTGFRLRSKRTLRCRRDVEEGKMSILVQPKLFPLEGDSSQKLQRGKWFVKDSSATHEVLSIIITKLPNLQVISGQQGQVSYFYLTITNPKDYKVRVKIAKSEYPSSSTTTTPDSTVRRPFSCATCELQLKNTEDISFNLGAFEDELLRDDEDDDVDDKSVNSAKSSENAKTELLSRGWSYSVSHNVGHLVLCVEYMQLHVGTITESTSVSESKSESESGIVGSKVYALPLIIMTEALEVAEKDRVKYDMTFEAIIACPTVSPIHS
jgi:hypothetical protein